jgi:hypothetical protein
MYDPALRGRAAAIGCGEITLRQPCGQSFLHRRISPADAGDHAHPAGEPRGVAIRVTGLAGDHQKVTPPFGIGQREEQAAIL